MTTEDIKLIDDLLTEVTNSIAVGEIHETGKEEYYREVLRRYNLLQKQSNVDLETEIEWEWAHREKQEIDFLECAEMDKDEFVRFALLFYELGQREMRNRISNPEYNKQVVDKMKSEHPIAATEEELKKAIKERYPMPKDADVHTRDRIVAARNGFLSGYSYELGRKENSK